MAKTPRKVSDIAPTRLNDLNQGRVASTVLTECLAVDFAVLMQTAFPDISVDAVQTMRDAAGQGITRRMALAANIMAAQYGPGVADHLAAHPSDTLRGWACYVRAGQGGALADLLTAMRPLADDDHFGVREWAWLALRPHLAADVPVAIAALAPWTGEPSPYLRRFAVESLRPRGVWCSHIKMLKDTPELALPLLNPLRNDPERYVQDSVANWLNDAAKSQPDWVRTLCANWLADSNNPATAYICKRAQRSL